jgi:hypothetical protein
MTRRPDLIPIIAMPHAIDPPRAVRQANDPRRAKNAIGFAPK